MWLASHLEIRKSSVPIVHYYKNKKAHGATDRVHSLSKEWHHSMSCITNNEHLIWEVVRFTLWIKAEYSMVQNERRKIKLICELYSPICTFISYKKNSRARALTKDMGRARKKKYVRANFELKQEKTAAMFLFENTNPSNICFFYCDVSKTFWETFHLWIGECSTKFYFFWQLEIVWGVFDTIDDFASITNLPILIAEY